VPRPTDCELVSFPSVAVIGTRSLILLEHVDVAAGSAVRFIAVRAQSRVLHRFSVPRRASPALHLRKQPETPVNRYTERLVSSLGISRGLIDFAELSPS
jgi:hypothetical protein